MSPVGRYVALSLVLWVVPVAPPANAAVAAGGAPAATERHRVDLRWKPDQQDVLAGTDTIMDTFDSFGPPFVRGAPVEMLTPREQATGTDDRSGTWRVFLTKGANPGRCKGTFEIRKNIVETTSTSQTVTYRGTMKLTGCRGVRKFRDVRPGRFGDVTGRSVCVVGGCRGALVIEGSVRY